MPPAVLHMTGVLQEFISSSVTPTVITPVSFDFPQGITCVAAFAAAGATTGLRNLSKIVFVKKSLVFKTSKNF